MDLHLVIFSCLTIILNLFAFASSETCTREVYGDTQRLTCPRPTIDSRDKTFCCGPKKLRYCCSIEEVTHAINDKNYKGDNNSDKLKASKVVKNTIGVIVGVLVSAIVVVVIVVVISCFCCSCCLLARRRKRGHVYGPATTTPMTAAAGSTVTYPSQQMTYPQQKTEYPQQAPPAYPDYQTQQPYPPQGQQPYPPQGQQPYPPQGQQPYPPQGQPQAYPPPQGQYPPSGGYQGTYPPASGGYQVPPPYPMTADPNNPAYNPGYGN